MFPDIEKSLIAWGILLALVVFAVGLLAGIVVVRMW